MTGDSNDEALYALFLKHYEKINILIQAGVFEMHNANVVIHFNHAGKIGKIDGNKILFYQKLSPNDGKIAIDTV